MKNKILFAIIIVFAIVFRFYQLGINPPSLTWDEAAWGYNAYTIGIDGKDEFGRFMPVDYLESFGDFKPPVYAYLDVIPVKIFGLTPFATRFPSALLGVLTVIVSYFLTKRVFFSSEKKNLYGLIAAGMLAISPWHVMLSRAAFEANVATFFLVCGVWLFLAAMQEKKWYLIFSAISFVLSIYTFNSARVVAPILVIVLSLLFWKKLLGRKKQVIFACIVGILLILPTAKFLLSPQAKLRFQEVNIFSDISVIKTVNQQIANDKNNIWSKILHNRRLAFAEDFLQHYFDAFNPAYLFIKGDGNPKFSDRDVGEMYLWDVPFFIVGIFLLFKKREGYWWIIPLWLLIGIIPSATARETPHALRTEAVLPTFQMLTAYGISQFVTSERIKKLSSLFRKGIFAVVGGLLFLEVVYAVHGYIAYYPWRFSGEWQYGYQNSIAFIQKVENSYDEIRITDALGRPYIYYLFYEKVVPSHYRSQAIITRDAFGFVTVQGFGKYRFGKGNANIPGAKKILYIDTPENVPAKATIDKTFYLLDGSKVLIAYHIT
ncbi:MAG: phospholipid carrier-dependent glycosyltransferase [Candidatus Levyibacteriota bacterium]